MNKNPDKPEGDPLLVDVRVVAAKLSICVNSVWSLLSAGKLPMPVKLGRRTLWRSTELAAWVLAGCPPQDKWDASTHTKY